MQFPAQHTFNVVVKPPVVAVSCRYSSWHSGLTCQVTATPTGSQPAFNGMVAGSHILYSGTGGRHPPATGRRTHRTGRHSEGNAGGHCQV